jgi:3-oxoacyl-[acyl-carrier-protein] synthase-3
MPLSNDAAHVHLGEARRVRFASIAAAQPPRIVASEEVEEQLRAHSPEVRFMPGLLEMMTGIRSRRYAAPHTNTSDLAAEAGCRALARAGLERDQIDLLIFASAGQDLIEPATAHITQHKLGTAAPVMDVKNACNSFINGVQVGEALILTGQYRRVLVVTGEVLSLGIKWCVADKTDLRLSFPGYTFGDAGAAAVLEESHDGSGIFYRKFMAESAHWAMGTFPGGGTMHPRGEEHSYFRGDGALLKEVFLEVGPPFLRAALRESGTCLEDFDRIFVHQVTMPFLDILLRVTGIPRAKVAVTLPEYGNMAAASLPVAFSLAEERGEVRRGDRIMFIGLAGGISLGVLMFQF